MAENFNTGVPSLDPKELKSKLKDFLSGQSEFNSYNFDGSALSTTIDLLTKNTHYLSFIANMMARESFISRAQLKKNIVEHAQRLSYVPSSMTSPTIEADITITPDDTSNLESFIIMPENTQFTAQYDGEVVTFVTQDEYVLYLTTDNVYKRSGIVLKQGDLINERFVYDGGEQRFVISNPNIDISTLVVNVINSETDNTTNSFSKVKNITIVKPDSQVYFLYENGEGKYKIEFGDDVLGQSLVNGNIVEIKYVALNSDVVANNISDLTMITSVDGYVDADLEVKTPSYGGSLREEQETIRRSAPLAWEAQERSVTPNDYVVNLKKLFPQAKSAISWGGEDNDPPMWGNVMIAVNTTEGIILADIVKDNIKGLLKKTNVGSITPVIVDPEYVDIDIDLSIGYDATKSTTSMSEEFSKITQVVKSFSSQYLEDFERNFIDSHLTSIIKSRDPVVSCDIDISMTKHPVVSVGVEGRYVIKFNNEIEPESVEGYGFTVVSDKEDARLYDDGEGTLKIDCYCPSNEREVIVNDAGTVDYENGEISLIFKPIAVEEIDNRINVKVNPTNENVLAVRQNIFRIDNINITENQSLRVG